MSLDDIIEREERRKFWLAVAKYAGETISFLAFLALLAWCLWRGPL